MAILVLLLVIMVSCNAFISLNMPSHRLSSSINQKNKFEDTEIEGDLTPVANYCLIKVKEIQETTDGGVYMPDNAKERPTEGVVIAHGPGRIHPETAYQLNMPVNIGDCVMYGKYDGTVVNYNGQDHQLIRDDDILLTYTGKDATLESVECVKDQVLVLLDEASDTSSSGLYTKDSEEDQFKMRDVDSGVVVKLGPGRQAGNGEFMTGQLKIGDHVKFRDFAGSDVKLNGKTHAVIRAYDILATS